ncbi:hypothetical protein OAV76_01740 [Schleiferiaceae bacterium]|nr:hypothetical protein [Schleiferiaceae bacterium]
MNVIIYCVYYNSPDALDAFLSSINVAKRYGINVTVCLSDNSCNAPILNDRLNFTLHTVESDNIGYFGGVARLLLDHDYPGWKVISNVDIVFTEQFWKGLLMLVNSSKYSNSCIAPAIIDERYGVDRNPKLVTRYSKSYLRFLKFLYGYNMFGIYKTIGVLKNLFKKNFGTSEEKIYCPHGSCMIFGLNTCLKDFLPYPSFLFGEELWLAEKFLKKGVPIYYDPGLRVLDKNHASTGLVNRVLLNKWNAQSCDLILRTFYNE